MTAHNDTAPLAARDRDCSQEERELEKARKAAELRQLRRVQLSTIPQSFLSLFPRLEVSHAGT
jgi:hypothetical protein